jgi:hypothetical protein
MTCGNGSNRGGRRKNESGTSLLSSFLLPPFGGIGSSPEQSNTPDSSLPYKTLRRLRGGSKVHGVYFSEEE